MKFTSNFWMKIVNHTVFPSSALSYRKTCLNKNKVKDCAKQERADKHTRAREFLFFRSLRLLDYNYQSNEVVPFSSPSNCVFLSVLLFISLFISPPSSWWKFHSSVIKSKFSSIKLGKIISRLITFKHKEQHFGLVLLFASYFSKL